MSDRIRSEPLDLPNAGSGRAPRRERGRTPLIRMRHLIWVPVLGGTVLAAMVWATPHLRFKYNFSAASMDPFADRYYHWCDYLGLNSQRIIPLDGHCPFIAFLTAPGEG